MKRREKTTRERLSTNLRRGNHTKPRRKEYYVVKADKDVSKSFAGRKNAGAEIPDDEYLATLRADGSMRDIWQTIIRQGLKDRWKITIPHECEEHNRKMIAGAAPLQKWLSACKPAPTNVGTFRTMQEIYENYMFAVNPDADLNGLLEVLRKNRSAAKWEPSPKKDGIDGKSKNEVRSNLIALGFAEGRIKNQRGFYIYLPVPADGMILPNSECRSIEPITTDEAWEIFWGETVQKILT